MSPVQLPVTILARLPNQVNSAGWLASLGLWILVSFLVFLAVSEFVGHIFKRFTSRGAASLFVTELHHFTTLSPCERGRGAREDVLCFVPRRASGSVGIRSCARF